MGLAFKISGEGQETPSLPVTVQPQAGTHWHIDANNTRGGEA
ncbi:hypothetical protein BCL67_1263 [Nesterenkonia sandarakina]|uniref:Uncharacterized protein n=1 Tax=Nesterenkonia sandarakina TaxID=272918 RepID=A0A2T0YBA7_9MICC|nr:hypothetical protein BCL67_1263 [Nesterenkonia sandarakina]